MGDILHNPNITKNLVSTRLMFEQGLQVRFNSHWCFVEDIKNDCCLIAKGNRNDRMFTPNVGRLEMSATMFAHGKGIVANINIWHNFIGHVNV